MASRIMPPLGPRRPPPAWATPCRFRAPRRPSPPRLLVQGAGAGLLRLPPLPAAAVPAGPARVPGARPFSAAGPASRKLAGRSRSPGEPTLTERRLVDSRKVILSWMRPARPVKLMFQNHKAALEAQKAFSSHEAMVLGLPVMPKTPQHSVKPFGWTMDLMGVSDAATKKDIVAGLPREAQPKHVTIGQGMPEADVDEAAAELRSKVEDIAPLSQWRYPLPSHRRVKAKVLFAQPADATHVVETFNGQRLTFKDGTHARLAAQLYTTIRLRVNSKLYKATQAQIEEAMSSWRQKHLKFLAASWKDDSAVVLHMESDHQNYQTLVDATEAVETILDGHLVVSEDGKRIWHPGFNSNLPWFDKIKSLEAEYPVYIIRSREKGQLTVSGRWEQCRLAMKGIAAIADEANSADEAKSAGDRPLLQDTAAPFS